MSVRMCGDKIKEEKREQYLVEKEVKRNLKEEVDFLWISIPI